jgi:glutamine synthetase
MDRTGLPDEARPEDREHALDLHEREPLFSEQLGDVFMSYYLQLKRTEAGRYVSFCKTKGIETPGDEPTEWEQNEYFDFF